MNENASKITETPMVKPKALTTPLTPEERHALVWAPLPTVRVYGGRAWGGVFIRSNIPLEGRRTYSPWWPDEEMENHSAHQNDEVFIFNTSKRTED